jgi:hypothetical protein
MWSVIVLIIFFLFFRQASGFSKEGSSIFDLKEFNSFPPEARNALQVELGAIMDALGNKFTQEWNTLTPAEKSNAFSSVTMTRSKIVQNIKDAPNTMTAFHPATHADVPKPPVTATQVKTGAPPPPVPIKRMDPNPIKIPKMVDHPLYSPGMPMPTYPPKMVDHPTYEMDPSPMNPQMSNPVYNMGPSPINQDPYKKMY